MGGYLVETLCSQFVLLIWGSIGGTSGHCCTFISAYILSTGISICTGFWWPLFNVGGRTRSKLTGVSTDDAVFLVFSMSTSITFSFSRSYNIPEVFISLSKKYSILSCY